MTTATKTQTLTTCGFCSFGNAPQLCPGGVRNGDGTIVLCGCTKDHGCNAGKLRCTQCNERHEGVGTDWRCIDQNECEARIQAKLAKNPTIQQIERAREAAKQRQAVSAPRSAASVSETPRKPSRPSSGQCLCCGEPTKGGKFLPGHDSKYLNRLVEQADDEALALAEAVSPAFAGKYLKRTAA